MTSRAAAKKQTDPHNIIRGLVSTTGKLAEMDRSVSELSAGLIRVQDQERRRIARDLHDSLGQMVVILKMNLDAIAKVAELNPEAAELLAQSAAMADTMSREIRTISYLLHPPLLDEVGLVSALKGLADEFSQRSGILASLHVDGDFAALPGDLAISVYRIVQESLTNVHRHSGSPTARIRIERRESELRLEIQDDGKGMAAGKSAGKSGVGLGGMRERAALLGGTLEVNSSEKGTTVIARLPCRMGLAKAAAG